MEYSIEVKLEYTTRSLIGKIKEHYSYRAYDDMGELAACSYPKLSGCRDFQTYDAALAGAKAHLAKVERERLVRIKDFNDRVKVTGEELLQLS